MFVFLDSGPSPPFPEEQHEEVTSPHSTTAPAFGIRDSRHMVTAATWLPPHGYSCHMVRVRTVHSESVMAGADPEEAAPRRRRHLSEPRGHMYSMLQYVTVCTRL